MGVAVHASGVQILTEVAIIWAAHIGFDRVLGYGLKYPTAFADTHLSQIGYRGTDKS
jgi:hypothetical protein